MVASTLITDYLGEGTHAARPAAPNIPTGGTAIYYETDTTNTFAWSGVAWIQINGSGSGGLTAPTIVQVAKNSGAAINGATFGAAPTNGNLLVAFCLGDRPSPTGTWHNPWTTDTGGILTSNVYFKLAGAGEPAAQQVQTGTSATGYALFELANAIPGPPTYFDQNASSNTINADAFGIGGIIIGAVANESTTTLPTSITGAVSDGTAVGTANAIQAFHKTAPTKGIAANAINATFAAAQHARMATVYIGAGG